MSNNFNLKDIFNLEKVQKKGEEFLNNIKANWEKNLNEGKKFLKETLGI